MKISVNRLRKSMPNNPLKLGRLKDHNKVIPIIELYTAIQSEGSRAGYPTMIVRTTGCTHRCYFAEGGWCDTWYTSIHADKGQYTFNDVQNIYKKNPHIKELMLTGGAPSMHPDLVNELTHFSHQHHLFMTLETEGSHFLATDYPIDLLSISPKFSNSIPQLGVKTPQGKLTDEKMIQQHHKFRLNYAAMQKMIAYHKDYHIKPVLDINLSIIDEIEVFLQKLNIPDEKVWVMPAGDDRASLIKSYGVVMNYARDRGWRFTPRPHIIAFNDQRCV